MRWFLVLFLRGYRRFLSPYVGGGCRFTPSCSEYALEAVRRHGTVRGTRLAIGRLRRCTPEHPEGHDPVPE
jgi:putative membrane protein insertion efficiency factor